MAVFNICFRHCSYSLKQCFVKVIVNLTCPKVPPGTVLCVRGGFSLLPNVSLRVTWFSFHTRFVALVLIFARPQPVEYCFRFSFVGKVKSIKKYFSSITSFSSSFYVINKLFICFSFFCCLLKVRIELADILCT